MRWLLLSLALFGCSANNVEVVQEPIPQCAPEKHQILEDEGVVLSSRGYHIAYLDSKGHLTGGHGHLFDAKDKFLYPLGSEIHPKVAEYWFKRDYLTAKEDVLSYLDGAKVPIQIENVLINMAFNLGLPRLEGFKNMKQAIFFQDWEAMANEMEKSNWYSDVGNRAKRLVHRVRMFNAQGSSYCNELDRYRE